jgi:type II secretory pathway pseudopilin PulG
MVIVLLGIIAAIAIPQYVDLKRDAQDATADGIVGAIISAGAIGYAKGVVADTLNDTYPDITDLEATYLKVKKVNLNLVNVTSWTAMVGGHTYTFTYTQNDGGAGYARF